MQLVFGGQFVDLFTIGGSHLLEVGQVNDPVPNKLAASLTYVVANLHRDVVLG